MHLGSDTLVANEYHTNDLKIISRKNFLSENLIDHN